MASTSAVSIPLTELLLRPSTLRRFTKRGFESTDEIEESRANGGINLLAAELDVSLQEAAGLIREVQGCLGSYEQSRARSSGRSREENNNNSDGEPSTKAIEGYSNNGSDDNDTHQQQQQQPQPIQCYDDGIVTAYELLRMNDGNGIAGASGTKRNPCHIVTFCRSIDNLLGGGIALGEVTEVAGLPGTGKTQLATQLSVLARLPHVYGGVEGRTLYVDAEGSFLAERAHSMADALCHHVRGRAHGSASTDFTTETILDSIDVFRVHDEAALLATLYSLRDYIESSAIARDSAVMSPSSPSLPVRLIVIDSIAFHFRAVVPTDSSYYVQRTKTLTALAAYLGELAHQHDLAVVVINQMTTKIGNGSGGTAASVVPALGESWAHATATRLLLSKDDRSLMGRAATSDNYDSDNDDDESDRLGLQARRREMRTCSLTKSAHRPTGTARYRVVEEGIRDVGENERIRRGMSDTGNNKRPRTH